MDFPKFKKFTESAQVQIKIISTLSILINHLMIKDHYLIIIVIIVIIIINSSLAHQKLMITIKYLKLINYIQKVHHHRKKSIVWLMLKKCQTIIQMIMRAKA